MPPLFMAVGMARQTPPRPLARPRSPAVSTPKSGFPRRLETRALCSRALSAVRRSTAKVTSIKATGRPAACTTVPSSEGRREEFIGTRTRECLQPRMSCAAHALDREHIESEVVLQLSSRSLDELNEKTRHTRARIKKNESLVKDGQPVPSSLLQICSTEEKYTHTFMRKRMSMICSGSGRCTMNVRR